MPSWTATPVRGWGRRPGKPSRCASRTRWPTAWPVAQAPSSLLLAPRLVPSSPAPARACLRRVLKGAQHARVASTTPFPCFVTPEGVCCLSRPAQAFLHSRRVLHRDLKPSNVLLQASLALILYSEKNRLLCPPCLLVSFPLFAAYFAVLARACLRGAHLACDSRAQYPPTYSRTCAMGESTPTTHRASVRPSVPSDAAVGSRARRGAASSATSASRPRWAPTAPCSRRAP